MTGPTIPECPDGKVATWWKPEKIVFADPRLQTSVREFDEKAVRKRFVG